MSAMCVKCPLLQCEPCSQAFICSRSSLCLGSRNSLMVSDNEGLKSQYMQRLCGSKVSFLVARKRWLFRRFTCFTALTRKCRSIAPESISTIWETSAKSKSALHVALFSSVIDFCPLDLGRKRWPSSSARGYPPPPKQVFFMRMSPKSSYLSLARSAGGGGNLG